MFRLTWLKAIGYAVSAAAMGMVIQWAVEYSPRDERRFHLYDIGVYREDGRQCEVGPDRIKPEHFITCHTEENEEHVSRSGNYSNRRYRSDNYNMRKG